MGFEYLTNVPLHKAREEYLALLNSHGYSHKTEVIPVWNANGRVTAQAVYAHICAPHYAASARTAPEDRSSRPDTISTISP